VSLSSGNHYRRLDTEVTDTANLLFGNPYSHQRTTNLTAFAARAPTEFSSELRIATLALANVKDEPRRDLARLVPHHDFDSVASFRNHIPSHEA